EVRQHAVVTLDGDLARKIEAQGGKRGTSRQDLSPTCLFTRTATLYKNRYPVQEPLPCTKTATLYKNRYPLQEPLPCTKTATLYKNRYPLQKPLPFTKTAIIDYEPMRLSHSTIFRFVIGIGSCTLGNIFNQLLSPLEEKKWYDKDEKYPAT
ncbi:MAG: hypothetical protein AAF443_02540, partial [Chlamydiota bacterium]